MQEKQLQGLLFQLCWTRDGTAAIPCMNPTTGGMPTQPTGHTSSLSGGGEGGGGGSGGKGGRGGGPPCRPNNEISAELCCAALRCAMDVTHLW